MATGFIAAGSLAWWEIIRHKVNGVVSLLRNIAFASAFFALALAVQVALFLYNTTGVILNITAVAVLLAGVVIIVLGGLTFRQLWRSE